MKSIPRRVVRGVVQKWEHKNAISLICPDCQPTLSPAPSLAACLGHKEPCKSCFKRPNRCLFEPLLFAPVCCEQPFDKSCLSKVRIVLVRPVSLPPSTIRPLGPGESFRRRRMSNCSHYGVLASALSCLSRSAANAQSLASNTRTPFPDEFAICQHPRTRRVRHTRAQANSPHPLSHEGHLSALRQNSQLQAFHIFEPALIKRPFRGPLVL